MPLSRNVAETTLALALVLAASAHAGWTRYSGPTGGTPAALAVGGGTLFARTADAVYRSPDSGTTWTRLAGEPDRDEILSLGVRDSLVFYGTRTGIFRSRDGGGTWARADEGIPDTSIAALAAFAPRLVFAGTGAGVFRSQDDGASWERVLGGYVPAFSFGDSVLFALDGDFAYRSRDRGATWIKTPIGPSSGGVTGLVKLGSTLIASSRSVGLYRSDDGGDSWTPHFEGLPAYDIQELFAGDSVLFANLPGGITIRSGDKGATWAEADSGLDGIAIGKLAALGPALIAGAKDDGGMFRSLDNGKSWAYLEHSLKRRELLGLHPAASGLFAFTTNTVFRSRNEGVTWERVLAVPGIVSFVAGDSAMFAAAGNAVHRSRDGGTTWVPLAGPGNPLLSLSTPGSVLIASTRGGGVSRSLDQGETWSPSAQGAPLAGFAFLAVSGPALIAAGKDASGIHRSLDTGRTWSLVFQAGGIRALAASGSAAYASTAPGALYRSRDNGATWDKVAASQTSWFESIVLAGERVIAGSYGDGLYSSRDGGDTWTRFYEGSRTVYSVFAVRDSLLIAGLSPGTGVWHRPVSDLNGATGLRPRVARGGGLGGMLRAGHPIRFSLGERARVRLRIFDSRGRPVATLLDAVLEAGDHQAPLEFRGPPGTYYLRSQAGNRERARVFVWEG